ncbi:MAG: zinc ribbon domain-containing protein, partial [Ruminococcus sp.]|nr:zinc ribbon domain-containing protein [Ruminococcus sp.]
AVVASKELISELEARLLALKGYVKCTNCGASVPFEDNFCGKCGKVIEKPEPAPEEVYEEEITPTVSVVPDDDITVE